ncbi:MAG: hypothetical protein HQ546_03005, partial [Planctomycetes bacterium]|nr:hypothetical protein [Planctomycetota bacterium]
MAESFDRILAAARRRVSLNVLLAQCALVLAAAAVPAAVVVVVQRAIAVQLIFIWTIWAFVVLVGVCAGVLWYRRRPGRMRTALLVDERLALRERFSTALAVAGMDAPFALAAIEDARRVARSANLEGYFPVGLSSRWLHAVGGWFIVLMLALLLPELDVFGRAGEKRGRQEKAERLS